MRADLVFLNGSVITLDKNRTITTAAAVAGDRILLVGDDAEIREYVGSRTQVVDLAGRALVPGFNDAHCHPMHYGRSLSQIDCRPQVVRRVDQITAAIQQETERHEPGQWIQGRGYDDSWLEPNFAITRLDLDPVSPYHPVCLTRACGHVIVVNSQALAQAGIDRNTADPPGGQIDRDQAGEPTGVLRETAMELVYSQIPPDSPAEAELYIKQAALKYLAAGITSVHDAMVEIPSYGAYLRLHQAKSLPLRVTMMVEEDVFDFLSLAGLASGFGDDWLRVGPLKILLDGGIGARTAAMSEPYANDPGNRGILWMEQPELNALVQRAFDSGFQVATHAIGDRAIESALTAYEQVLTGSPRPDHRFRIEHLSLPLGDQIERVANLGIFINSQPIFVKEAGDAYLANLGEVKAHLALPFKRLLDAHIPLAGSSDSPVSCFAPMQGIQTAVTRCTANGVVLGPDQRLSLEEALRMFTLGGACASGEQNIKGTITEGKLADMVVLSQDPFQTHPDELGSIEIDMTILNGQIVYRKS